MRQPRSKRTSDWSRPSSIVLMRSGRVSVVGSMPIDENWVREWDSTLACSTFYDLVLFRCLVPISSPLSSWLHLAVLRLRLVVWMELGLFSPS